MATVEQTASIPWCPAAARGAAARAAEPARTRNRVRDLTALVLLATCCFLLVALASFHPGDPPLSRTFPPNAPPANACGLIGSAVAGGLYEAIGLAAWFGLGLLVALDVALLARRPLVDLPVRTAGAAIAMAAACTLLAGAGAGAGLVRGRVVRPVGRKEL